MNPHQLSAFQIDRPELGFHRGRSYPGYVASDGSVVAFNDSGAGHKLLPVHVRIDVDHWRRRCHVDQALSHDETEARMAIAFEVRAAYDAAADIARPGVAPAVNTAKREAIQLALRNIAEIVDPELARSFWRDVPSGTTIGRPPVAGPTPPAAATKKG